jgi:two-component sensor histidine kinase
VGLPPYLQSAKYGEALFKALAAPLMILAFALLAAGYASEVLVTRYVRSLTRTAESIAEGNLKERSEVPYEAYEIGRLAHAFDEMADAIESNQAELRDLVRERDVLIRELNHRVKNNLQIMLSLLHMGGRDITAETAQERLKSLMGRVRTLAEIHRLLYQEFEERPAVDRYLERLAALLGEFYDLKFAPVEIDPEMRGIGARIGQSISVGLVLNELVANARKHAFPDGRSGSIRLRLRKVQGQAEDQAHLTVEDDGVGLPKDFDFAAGSSTGTRIVSALARQLGGRLWVERLPRGTAVHLQFPLPKAPESGGSLQA